jgi:mono/diheme cytochrome c family protein
MNVKPTIYAIPTVLVFALAATLPAFSARREHLHDLQRQTSAAQPPASPDSAGAAKYKQNCSRCHEAPQGFSPRISGTILRHMRVRASLSAQDERDILHFLNP